MTPELPADETRITQLEAEVARLKKFIDDYDVMEPVELRDVKRERDEARAREAALLKTIQHIVQYGCELDADYCHIEASRDHAAARALLDRLHEFEQGSEPPQEHGQAHPWPQFTCWHEGEHAVRDRPMPCKAPLRCFWRWTRKTGVVLDQTGIITDRLQRAKAVVEAAKKWGICCGLCGTAYSEVQVALAAWEEGKA